MDHSLLNMTSMRKVAMLFRDHRLDQILNALQFGYHAVRGFSTARLPYDPLWLIFNVNVRCNLRCRYCKFWGLSAHGKRPSYRDMDLEMFRQILNRFPRTIAVDFSGGEPLLNPDLPSMVRLAHERRMKSHLITNGTLLPGQLDAFLEMPFEFVNISFYGSNAETFANLTGASPSLFDDMVKAVAELCRRRPPGGFPHIIRASFICTKDNLELVPDFIRLCEELGVDQVKLKNLHIHGMLPFSRLCLFEDDPEAQDFVDHLLHRRFRIPVVAPRLFQRKYHRRPCIMPFRALIIDGDGSIAPCCIFKTAKRWGNALEEPDIWNGPTMVNMRQRQLDLTRPLPDACLDCFGSFGV